MPKSTVSSRSRKSDNARPKKPYDDFPLSPHPSGAWQKKIKGRIFYFGRWGRVVDGKMQRLPDDGWQTALALYKAQVDDLQAGKTPRAKLVNGEVVTEAKGLTVKVLCDTFYTAKLRKLESGELSPRMLTEYDATLTRLRDEFGRHNLVDELKADNFAKLRAKLAKQFGPVRLANEIQKVRTVFKYAYESALIEKPVRFGPEFVKPPKHVMRKHRASGGGKLFTADEVRSMLDGKSVTEESGEVKRIAGASVQLRAMILLGVNAAFGNADCGTLPLSAVDLDGGWIRYPRPKTGIERRCPLWPETITALRAAIADRPSPKSAAVPLVFVTKYGHAWSAGGSSDAVTLETRKLLHRLDINGRRGLGFYTLRHTFRTIADATRDFPAVRLVMGHADDSIDDVYREHIDDDRLHAVVDHVWRWLFAAPSSKAKGVSYE